MSKFKVIIEEHISKEFDVEASSLEEATKIAQDKYYDCEFIVDDGYGLISKLMMAQNEDGTECTEWEEF